MMRIIFLKRFLNTSQMTIGVLSDYNRMYGITIENPWLDNKQNISCIPCGSYHCELVQSRKFGKVYGINNVPGRSNILIHPMNFVNETDGCIGLGDRFIYRPETNEMGVGNSRITIQDFIEYMGGETFKLNIMEL